MLFFSSSVVNADTCPNPSDDPCWVARSPMPTARRDLGVAADSSGKIYAVGGHNGSQFLDTLEVYDSATDTWATKSPAPVARNDMGFAYNSSNGKFYFGGGYNEGLHSEFFEYDPVADTWTAKSSLLTARAGLRFAAGQNGNIYAIGGCFLNTICVTNVEEYNPSTDQWIIKSAIPNTRSDFGLVVVPNGKLYVISGGGYPNGIPTILNNVDEYDPVTDTWTAKASIANGRLDLGVSVNSDGKIYAVGGSDSLTVQHYSAEVNEYDSLTNIWTTKSQLPIALYGMGMALGGDGNVYVIGGQTVNSPAVNTNYAGILPPAELNVPLLKQISSPWQSEVYDSANIWSPAEPTINRWGCAMTSAAMVFQYYGIKKLPDGTTLDPGTLNNWLKSQSDGYVNEGWVNWIAISRLSRLAKDINGITAFNALEYQRVKGEDKSQLESDINNGIPVILEVPGHFIVGKGIVGESFSINDPFYDRTTLADYSNTFLSLGKYVPSFTDLSYIMLVTDPNVSLKILDNTGVEMASGFVQQPMNDAADTGKHNKSITILYFQKPESGQYRIVVSGQSDKVYKFFAYLYDINGNVNLITQQGILTPNLTNLFEINFDKNNSHTSKINKAVTFQSAIDDVRQLDRYRLINHIIANTLIRFIKNSEVMHLKNKYKQAMQSLNAGEKLLKTSKNKLIDIKAYEILTEDILSLKKLL